MVLFDEAGSRDPSVIAESATENELTSGRVPKTGDRQPSTPTSLNVSHIRKGRGAASAIKLLDEWMADESGYDEETWPDLKVGLERARLSNRKLFDD